MGKEQSDSDILRDIANGNVEAFRFLIERYEAKVFRIIGARVPRDDVRDISHDVFVSAFRSLTSFRGDQPFEHWIARIARNRAVDYWREKRRSREVPDSALGDDQRRALMSALALESSAEFERAAEQEHFRQLLYRTLGELTPAEREVLILAHFEGHDHKSIAQMLGWSVVNVKVRIFRARQKLHAFMHRLSKEEDR